MGRHVPLRGIGYLPATLAFRSREGWSTGHRRPGRSSNADSGGAVSPTATLPARQNPRNRWARESNEEMRTEPRRDPIGPLRTNDLRKCLKGPAPSMRDRADFPVGLSVALAAPRM